MATLYMGQLVNEEVRLFDQVTGETARGNCVPVPEGTRS